MFKGKKVVIVGERDGVPGPAIASCVEAAGGAGGVSHNRMLRLNSRRNA